MPVKRSARAKRDLAAILAVATIALVVAFYFDVFEEFEQWAQRYERWEVDEFVVVPLVFGLAFGFYFWRRWKELKAETSEREEAQNKLEESENRFRSLIQNASDIIMITGTDGTLSYISPAVEQILGYKPEDIVDTDSFVPVHPDDAERVQNLFAEVASKPGVTVSFELRLQHVDGSWRHIESNCTNLLHDPAVNGLVVNSRDITERKRAEKKLQESEANLAEAQRIAHLGSWEYTPKENKVYWSDETYRILGFTPRQFVPTFQDWMDSVQPEDRTLIQENMSRLFRDEQPRDSVEFRIVRTDGEVRIIDGQANAAYDETGELIKMVGTMQDVTEARLAQEKLRTSEAELRALFEAMNDLILVFDREGRCLKIAPTNPSNLYRPPEEMLGKTFHEVFPKEQADTFLERVQRTLETRSTNTFEFNLQLDDRLGWFEATFSPMLENTVVAVARDISERKENEEALRESESRLAEAQKLARIGSWEWDIVTDDVVWSDEIYRILDLDPWEFEVSSTAFLNRIHPDDREYVEDTLMEAYTNRESFSYEARILRPDEEMRIIHVRGEIAIEDAGTAVRMFGTTQDITETRLAEEQIRFQAHLLGQVQAAVIATDLEGTVTYWNEHAERLYGWSREETLGRHIAELAVGFAEVQAAKEITEYLRTGRAWEGEFVFQHRDGSTFPAYITASLIYDTQGQRVGMAGISVDITERKRAEEELRRSEQRFRRVVEHASDALIVHDPEGRIVDVNQRAAESLGYTREELLAMSVPDFEINFDPAALANLWEEMLPGRPVTVDGVHRRKDGATFPVEVRVGLFESEGHQLMLALARDVTERKRAEEELRRSEGELTEAQRIAHVGSWSFDMTRDEGRWSDEMYRIFGFAPQEFPITYKKFLNLVHPGDKEILRRAVRAALYEDKDWYSLDYRLVRPDGEIRFLHSQYKVVRDESGRPVRLVGTSQDVTERQQAEDELRRSESSLAEAQRIAHLGSWAAEPSNRAVPRMEHKMHWSDEMYRIFGFAPKEFVPTFKTLVEATHPQDREHVGRTVQGAVSRGESSLTVEHRILRPDGEVRFVQAQLEMVYDESGELQRNFGTVLDITERKRAEEELRKSEATNRAILEATPDLMFRVSRDGAYLDFRANDDSKLYVPRGEVIGKNVSDTMPPDLVAPMLRNIAKTLDTGEMQVFEYQLPMADEVLDFEVRLVVSGTEEVLAIVRDVTERKALERRLEHQAFHDALTDLPNRALFTDRLEHALVRAGRHQEESVAVLFLDLDNFKVANDSLGHEAGDQLLVAVAERLQTCLRSQDTLARLGGDEFTILLEDIEEISDAAEVAERVEKALRDPFEIKGQEVFVTASIGISLGGSDQDLPGLLLRNADLAMYQAKDTGKARYEMYEPDMNERALERLKLESELRRALEKNELRVYYQPKLQLVEWDNELQKHLKEANGQTIATPVALPTPRIVGAEALIRWEHPERGLVLPDQFIPIAEETGLIVPIGRWVLGEACRQAWQWQECHPSDPPLTICVNLSAKEFQQPDLTNTVAEILNETGLNPCSLNIEITESLLMEDTQHTIDTLQALKELGVQLSIDDFGTGYSSLSYLNRFPVDDLKIDKTFVAKLGKNYEDTALVSLMVNLSHSFGLKVVAEGVENDYQLRELRKLGCDQAQGYYFSKPLPSEEMSAKLGLGPGRDYSGLPN